MSADAEVCTTHFDAYCKACDGDDDDLWRHPRDIGSCRKCGNRYSRELSFYDDESLCPGCGDQEDLPIDVELSRDTDKIVTATAVRIDCRRCGDWYSGTYKAAHLGYQAHFQVAHAGFPVVSGSGETGEQR